MNNLFYLSVPYRLQRNKSIISCKTSRVEILRKIITIRNKILPLANLTHLEDMEECVLILSA
jgi:hypothetical protein